MLSHVREFVTGAATDFGFSEEEVGNIEIAVDEACTNIIKHAYRFSPDGLIKIKISTFVQKNRSGKFIIRIVDNGSSFDTTSYTPPDMTEYFRKLRRGGLGILLMKKLMDEVEYDIEPGPKNLIKLVKYLKHQNPFPA